MECSATYQEESTWRDKAGKKTVVDRKCHGKAIYLIDRKPLCPIDTPLGMRNPDNLITRKAR